MQYSRLLCTQSPSGAGIGRPTCLAVGSGTEEVKPDPITLALNAQNLALLTAGPLLADGLKHVLQFVNKLLALDPQVEQSMLLPPMLRLQSQQATKTLSEHPSQDESRFFAALPYEG